MDTKAFNSANNKTKEEKIINAATSLFARNGFEGASTRDICNMAGANIGMISYYFGGKKGLYERVINRITDRIIAYMTTQVDIPSDFDSLKKDDKIEIFLGVMDKIIDYFYSAEVTDDILLLIVREQVTSSVPLNSVGYRMFKSLLASILQKPEDDKEVILRAITIAGQVHSTRTLRQFSLNFMGKDEYSDDDILLIKNITKEQVKAILLAVGGSNE